MSNSLTSMRPAVARATRHAVFFVLASSVIAFSIAGDRLANDLTRQLASEQARLLSIALIPGSNDELADSFDRIRAETDRLIAVATLSESGIIESIYPDEIAYARAVEAGISRTTALSASVEVEGAPQPVWIIGEQLTALDGSKKPVVFLLRRHAHLAGWVLISSAIAAAIAVASLVVIRLVCGWFERRVVKPLRRLAGLESHTNGASTSNQSRSECWEETDLIATRLNELVSQLEESQERGARLERAKQWEILKKEEGFNSQLRRVKNQATTDPLTQLRNCAFLDEKLNTIIERQCEDKEDLTLVMIDIDNFKHHNDTRGHAAGDEVLRFVGQLLRGAIRPTDHAVRYGGDEFTLLLVGAAENQARAVVERIVKMFAQYASRFASEKPMSMSAGVATLDALGSSDAATLIAAADEALYAAKSMGKNTVAAHAMA